MPNKTSTCATTSEQTCSPRCKARKPRDHHRWKRSLKMSTTSRSPTCSYDPICQLSSEMVCIDVSNPPFVFFVRATTATRKANARARCQVPRPLRCRSLNTVSIRYPSMCIFSSLRHHIDKNSDTHLFPHFISTKITIRSLHTHTLGKHIQKGNREGSRGVAGFH